MSHITLSLILTAIGLLTVFSVLLLFLLSISVLMKVFKDKDEVPEAAAIAPVVLPKAPASSAVELIDVDEKTAAAIMAIVSHESDIPLAELKFHSIKKTD